MKKNYIYPRLGYLLRIYIPVYIISAIVFYLMLGVVWPPTLKHYLVFAGWTILTLIYLIYAYKMGYYEITKHEIKQRKGGNVLTYPFKDIIFIDEPYSSKKSYIHFVTNKGDERFLLHDKKRLVYKAIVERTSNLKTKDEVNRMFPKLKL